MLADQPDASTVTVIPQTGSIASLVAPTTGSSVVGSARVGEGAGGPQLDQLGQHGDGDLAVRGVAEVETDRGAHPVEELLRDAALGEVLEQGLAALVRGDQADEGRPGGGRELEGLLVAVTLGGDDHDGPLVRSSSAVSSWQVDDAAVASRASSARSASSCAIGERPTTSRSRTGTTGSMNTCKAPSLWHDIGM